MHTIIGQKMAPIHVAGRAKTLKQKKPLSISEECHRAPKCATTHVSYTPLIYCTKFSLFLAYC